MTTSVKLTVQSVIMSLAALALLGGAGDGGCLGLSAEEQCANTGGTWGTADYWPAPCGYDALTDTGPAAQPDEKVCICPSDKPNWKNGAGCQKCATHKERCESTGGSWGTADFWPTPCGEDPAKVKGRARYNNEGVCTCPADKPNWTDGTGCQKCRVIRCKGSAMWCSEYNGAIACNRQDGCVYIWGENYSPGTCKGWPRSCTSYETENGCYSQQGCSWTD